MKLGPSAASAIPKAASWPVWLLLTVAAAVIGYWMHSQGLGYYLSMISRMMIYGLAACSLNLISNSNAHVNVDSSTSSNANAGLNINRVVLPYAA